jgi:hypothetical protein
MLSYEFQLDRLGPGKCSIELRILSRDHAFEWWAFIEEVAIVPNQTTDLGLIQLNVSGRP